MTGANTEKQKLILGSAGVKDPAAITLDIDPAHNPDVVYNLNSVPWPFRDNQFKSIICHHVLEHLNDISGPMRELHRICSGDGEVYIEVPHHTSWCANTPEHKLRFNYFALEGYLEGGIAKWVTGSSKFRLIERKVTFHRAFRRYLLHKIFNRFPLWYERFWAYMFPAENVIFRFQPLKYAQKLSTK